MVRTALRSAPLETASRGRFAEGDGDRGRQSSYMSAAQQSRQRPQRNVAQCSWGPTVHFVLDRATSCAESRSAAQDIARGQRPSGGAANLLDRHDIVYTHQRTTMVGPILSVQDNSILLYSYTQFISRTLDVSY